MRTHLDLCSGIGGFALAAQWAGYQTIGFCEIDPWCRRVLAKNFPGVPMHDDVTTLDGRTVRRWLDAHERRPVHDAVQSGREHAVREVQAGRDAADGATLDLITGGYPCQPFSVAGKRLGAEDDRHLWPAIAALVADLRPRWCLFENVAGHVTLGLDGVLADLEEIGYACGAVVVPACAVNAPHRRDRVWIIAHFSGGHHAKRSNRDEVISTLGVRHDGLSPRIPRPGFGPDWENGIPRTTDHEPDRVNKLKALGNAIVPLVAYEIIEAMKAA